VVRCQLGRHHSGILNPLWSHFKMPTRTFGTSKTPPAPAPAPPPSKKMLRFCDLQTKGIYYHQNHLRRLIANGDFPKPTHLSKRNVVWPEDQIDRWLDAKIAESAA